MKEIICGAMGLLCATATSPAEDKAPFNRRVDLPLATVSWDISPEVVSGLIRDYLRSQGQVVKVGTRDSFDCSSFYNGTPERKTCRYVVWVEVPFDPNKP